MTDPGPARRNATTAAEVEGNVDFFQDMPYLRIGHGSAADTIVVLPGVSDALYSRKAIEEEGWPLRAYLERAYQPFVHRYRVWIVGRPRPLGTDDSLETMAQRYAEFLQEVSGPAHVRGESMGGMIALHIAAANDDLIRSLALVVSGCRIGPEAGAIMDEWRDLAQSGAWNELFISMASHLYAGWRRESIARHASLARALGFGSSPEDPSDFLTSIEACRTPVPVDTAARVRCPVMLVGGAQDPIFPPEVVRDTADALANAPGVRTEILQRAAHGLHLERKRELNNLMKSFWLAE